MSPKCLCGRVDCQVCATNPTPFHVAANPRDTVGALARRYRAVFGDDAWERASEDEELAEELGLTNRRAMVDKAASTLFKEDREAGLRDQWGARLR